MHAYKSQRPWLLTPLNGHSFHSSWFQIFSPDLYFLSLLYTLIYNLLFYNHRSTKAYYQQPNCRSQRPRGLKRGSADACLLGMRVRIPPGAWVSLSCKCCVLSDRGLWDGADHSSRGVLPIVICLSVIRCNNNPNTYRE